MPTSFSPSSGRSERWASTSSLPAAHSSRSRPSAIPRRQVRSRTARLKRFGGIAAGRIARTSSTNTRWMARSIWGNGIATANSLPAAIGRSRSSIHIQLALGRGSLCSIRSVRSRACGGPEGTGSPHLHVHAPVQPHHACVLDCGGGTVLYRLFPVPAGGAKVSDDGRYVRVRLSLWKPLHSGLAVAGGLAFVGLFVMAFGFRGQSSAAHPARCLGSDSWRWGLGLFIALAETCGRPLGSRP